MLCILVATGCDPLADNTYAGIPLVTFDGDFSSTTKLLEIPDGQLALFWQDPNGSGGPGAATTPVPYETTALGAFTTAIQVRPPSAVTFQFDDGGPLLAESYVLFVTEVPLVDTSAELGSDQIHAVIYAGADVTSGAAADYLGGPVTAGYHLRAFTPVDTPGDAQAQLIARCIANGNDADACTARRLYQLDAVDDTELLQIVLRLR